MSRILFLVKLFAGWIVLAFVPKSASSNTLKVVTSSESFSAAHHFYPSPAFHDFT